MALLLMFTSLLTFENGTDGVPERLCHLLSLNTASSSHSQLGRIDAFDWL